MSFRAALLLPPLLAFPMPFFNAAAVTEALTNTQLTTLLFGAGLNWRAIPDLAAPFTPWLASEKTGEYYFPGALTLSLGIGIFGIVGIAVLIAIIAKVTKNTKTHPLGWCGFAAVLLLIPGSWSLPAVMAFKYWPSNPEQRLPPVVTTALIIVLPFILGIILLVLSASFNNDKLRGTQYQLNVPTHLVNSLTAGEDMLFFHHLGIDFARMRWVLRDLATTGTLTRGGSTLPMQLAKVRHGLYHRSVREKLLQMLYSLWYTMRYSKSEQLAFYLDEVSFGHKVIGIRAAANAYFDKDVTELTVAEGELLVLTIENPHAFTPAHITQPGLGAVLPLSDTLAKRRSHIRNVVRRFGANDFLIGGNSSAASGLLSLPLPQGI